MVQLLRMKFNFYPPNIVFCPSFEANSNILPFLFQFLTIHLGQEETDCLSAWVNGKEIGLVNPSDQKGEFISADYENEKLKTLSLFDSRHFQLFID